MRKIITFILLVLFPFVVYADDTTIFSLDEVTASPGNNVTINLNMKNKQEFGVLTIRILYDNTKLTYVDSELSGLNNGQIRGIDKNNDKGLVAIYGITLNKKKLMKDNGNIATIEFKVLEDVKENIPITLEIKDFGKDESTTLNYEVKDGLIIIKDNVTTVDKKDKVSSTEIDEDLKKEGLDKEEITISSSDEDVATIDENGNINFKKDGNVNIIAKDKDGNIVYTKEYFVKNDIKNIPKLLIVSIIAAAIIIIIVIIILRKKKCKKRKQLA